MTWTASPLAIHMAATTQPRTVQATSKRRLQLAKDTIGLLAVLGALGWLLLYLRP